MKKAGNKNTFLGIGKLSGYTICGFTLTVFGLFLIIHGFMHPWPSMGARPLVYEIPSQEWLPIDKAITYVIYDKVVTEPKLTIFPVVICDNSKPAGQRWKIDPSGYYEVDMVPTRTIYELSVFARDPDDGTDHHHQTVLSVSKKTFDAVSSMNMVRIRGTSETGCERPWHSSRQRIFTTISTGDIEDKNLLDKLDALNATAAHDPGY